MKIKAKRVSINFDYEFLDGTSTKFQYSEPTTHMIDESIGVGDELADKLSFTKKTLKECISGDAELKEKMIDELTYNGNIYAVKQQLDEELGKQNKRG